MSGAPHDGALRHDGPVSRWRRPRVWFVVVLALAVGAATWMAFVLADGGTAEAERWSNIVFGAVAAAAVVASLLVWLWRQGASAHGTATGAPLTATARIDAGQYVRLPDEIGHRMVPRSGHAIDITVETRGAQAVILRRLEPLVVSRQPLPDARPVPHLGALPVRRFQLWLSEDPPRLVDDGPVGFPLKVSSGDPEILSVVAHVTGELVRWRLDLHWTQDGRDGVTPIDLDGVPFETAGLDEDR